MKANGAPEKLYLLPNGLISFCKNFDEDVEYVRKDAFIEKACEFLFENYHGEKLSLRMIEDFKNYIKGE